MLRHKTDNGVIQIVLYILYEKVNNKLKGHRAWENTTHIVYSKKQSMHVDLKIVAYDLRVLGISVQR